MAAVTFKIYTGNSTVKAGEKTGSEKPAFLEGQVIFAQKQGKIFMDWAGVRTDYSPIATVEGGGVNYIGISKTKPESATVTLINDTTVAAKPNDMVVWEDKEYLYRYGTGDKAEVLGWYEVGNEDAYNWVMEDDE